ncbi:MAG TPA: glycosyltransferase family 39 protein [Anaerolineales bacterium]|nr:glycosyltransferase family 39 protein [Anaerolineales bacterium]
MVLSTALVVIILLFYPFRYRIEFDPDEGINAIKAMMVLRGYRLYGEIWSDQPPFFTYVLAGWFRLFGLRLTAGRLLVLLFSAGMIALATNYLRKNWGAAAAICGGVTILLLPFFLRLSVSMMIGLPAIALAVASFYALSEWHDRPTMGTLVASSVLLGLSILTKGLSVILAPIWFIGILLKVVRDPGQRKGHQRWSQPLAWSGTLALMGIASVVLLIGPENIGQLLDVHVAAGQNEYLRTLPSLDSFLAESLAVFALALLGCAWAVVQRKWTALYLAAWLTLGYIVLRANQPSWYHHQLFLTIPAAILGAVAAGSAIEALRRLPSERPGLLRLIASIGSLAVFLVFLAGRGPGTVDGLDGRLPNFTGPRPDEAAERELLAAIYRYADETNWIFTDRPIFAFAAEIPVPPNLAVISQKRMLTGGLTEEEIAATLQAFSPEMILIGRFDLPSVREYMRIRNFQRIDQTLKYRLYFRPP